MHTLKCATRRITNVPRFSSPNIETINVLISPSRQSAFLVSTVMSFIRERSRSHAPDLNLYDKAIRWFVSPYKSFAGEERNFIRETCGSNCYKTNWFFAALGINGGDGGEAVCPRSIQVFRKRNSRMASHRHFHFRVGCMCMHKARKCPHANAFTYTHRVQRRARRSLVISYRPFWMGDVTQTRI